MIKTQRKSLVASEPPLTAGASIDRWFCGQTAAFVAAAAALRCVMPASAAQHHRALDDSASEPHPASTAAAAASLAGYSCCIVNDSGSPRRTADEGHLHVDICDDWTKLSARRVD